MLLNFDVGSWPPDKVKDWLSGLLDDSSWMNADYILRNNFNGRKLLIAAAKDLDNLGAKKVDLQEKILEAIERLRFYNFNITRETLQTAALRLASQSRALQRQLVANRTRDHISNETHSPKFITLSKDYINGGSKPEKQRVDLDTLAYVSAIVKTVCEITQIISRAPFSKYDDFKSMKSLILALSIELTSTAQRDQFVERPNDILEKSSKALADYCDRIVLGSRGCINSTKDVLLLQPFQLRTVRIRKGPHDNDLGILIRSHTSGIHVIEKIAPLSPAKKTNEFHEGDIVVYFNQFVAGWTAQNIQTLLDSCAQLNDVTIIVIKNPNE